MTGFANTIPQQPGPAPVRLTRLFRFHPRPPTPPHPAMLHAAGVAHSRDVALQNRSIGLPFPVAGGRAARDRYLTTGGSSFSPDAPQGWRGWRGRGKRGGPSRIDTLTLPLLTALSASFLPALPTIFFGARWWLLAFPIAGFLLGMLLRGIWPGSGGQR